MQKVITLTFIFTWINSFSQADLVKKMGDLTHKEDFTKAFELSDKYIKKDTLNSTVYFYRALCQRKNGDYESAFSEAYKSILLDKNNSDAYAELGNIFAMTQEFDKAL